MGDGTCLENRRARKSLGGSTPPSLRHLTLRVVRTAMSRVANPWPGTVPSEFDSRTLSQCPVV